jgi:hypothetical protein
MARLRSTRRTETAAEYAVASLLARHDHIVHCIDGRNDFGEDFEVDFTEDGERTGDTVRIQVKGGSSYRSAKGYRVPIGRHENDWANGNVPVLCVVHDPDTDTLFWANATALIRSARRNRKKIKSVSIRRSSVLDDSTLAAAVHEVRKFLTIYHGNRAIDARVAEMAGIAWDPQDWLQHFVNEFGEDAVFWQRPGENFARLLHSDLDWDPQEIWPDMLHFDTIRDFMKTYPHHEVLKGIEATNDAPIPKIAMVAGIILDEPEAHWLAACFGATEWMRDKI